MPSPDAPIGQQASLEQVLVAVRGLTNEVMALRSVVVPMPWRDRAIILGGSWFGGGLVANIALWVSYHQTVWALFHH